MRIKLWTPYIKLKTPIEIGEDKKKYYYVKCDSNCKIQLYNDFNISYTY